MQKKIYPFVAFLVLIATALACAAPLGGSGQPSANQVATIVAGTLQALTPASPSVETALPTSTPVGLLPHTLYFTNNDNTGIVQVFRLATDRKTITQLTTEKTAVRSYDVSLIDGSIAYVANNQLLLINADGSGRRMLVDGGAIDPNVQFSTSITSPVFSPDGQIIAYGYKGLNLYIVSTGASNRVLAQQANPNSPSLPGVTYSPKKYSPDGTKLLVSTIIPNSDGSATGIYSIPGNVLLPMEGDGMRVCCSEQAWTPDGSGLYTANATVGFFASGLWKIDTTTGKSTTLLPGDAGGGAYNLAAFPYLAPDGNLYFFYNTALNPNGTIDHAPLQMVRTAPDAITSRAVLRPETFTMLNEALWAPDASFVITATAPIQDVYQGGLIELYYTDSTKPMISLLPFGQQLKWGQ
jgi:WD40 repeat protein